MRTYLLLFLLMYVACAGEANEAKNIIIFKNGDVAFLGQSLNILKNNDKMLLLKYFREASEELGFDLKKTGMVYSKWSANIKLHPDAPYAHLREVILLLKSNRVRVNKAKCSLLRGQVKKELAQEILFPFRVEKEVTQWGSVPEPQDVFEVVLRTEKKSEGAMTKLSVGNMSQAVSWRLPVEMKNISQNDWKKSSEETLITLKGIIRKGKNAPPIILDIDKNTPCVIVLRVLNILKELRFDDIGFVGIDLVYSED